MSNLNVKGFRELNEKELKAVEGGRWSWKGAMNGVIAGALIGSGFAGVPGAIVGGIVIGVIGGIVGE
jgi:bacteriocin-like protein